MVPPPPSLQPSATVPPASSEPAADSAKPARGLLPDHFSFSAMSTFMQCPRKWAYTYVYDAPREFAPAALTFGSALHRGLEAFHWALLSGQQPSFEAAYESYARCWSEENAIVQVRFGPDEDRGFFDRMARVLLERYGAELLPAWGRLLAIEEAVRVELPDMGVPLVGRLDLLVEERACLALVDFKTAQKPFDAEKVRQGALQLSVYAQALGEVSESLEKPLAGRFVVLRKLLKPRIEIVEVPLDAERVRATAQMVGESWRLVRAAYAAGAFPPAPGWSCKGCPFQARCQRETGAPGLSGPKAP